LFGAGLTPVFKALPSSPVWKPIKPQTILLVKKALKLNNLILNREALKKTWKQHFATL